MDVSLSASLVGGASYLGRGDFVDRGGLPMFTKPNQTKPKKSQVSKKKSLTFFLKVRFLYQLDHTFLQLCSLLWS